MASKDYEAGYAAGYTAGGHDGYSRGNDAGYREGFRVERDSHRIRHKDLCEKYDELQDMARKILTQTFVHQFGRSYVDPEKQIGLIKALYPSIDPEFDLEEFVGFTDILIEESLLLDQQPMVQEVDFDDDREDR
jgi:hypothetical protein